MKLLTLITPLVLALLPLEGIAKTVRYELTVRNEKINLSGKKEVDFALTVNGGIPAPTLEFTEGDDAEILVKNEIPKEEVSIHWHGILLPPEEDGVAYVNTPPIHPGTSRLFKFKIRQNGTYWYHSHTAVQEQKGIYGALIIHPKKKAIQYDKDAVVVLSDWSDENADKIIRNLRKDGDYYLFKKDSVRSYFGAIRAGGLRSHLANEWDRMGGMDLSDVGYDAFLTNGKRDLQLLVAHPGEKVRVRIINAAASSYFYVSMGVPMTVISADGVDIEPVQTKELLMGMAETYDILFTVPEHKNYELRATVQDVTGYTSGWIGMGEKVPAPAKPLPDFYASMDHGAAHGGAGMSGMDHSKHNMGSMKGMDHSQHSGKSANTAHSQHSKDSETKDHHGDAHSGHGASVPKKNDPAKGGGHDAHSGHSSHEMHGDTHSSRSKDPIDWSTQSDAMLRQNSAPRDLKALESAAVLETLNVDQLKALEPTTLPKDAKVQELKLTLGGDMERYIWHINGKAIYQDQLIMINKGQVIRFTFENETMMHHPMHLHGHFFRVINENGERSPLKHTVDVPPHGTRTIEFYANEPGQWMLHCHNLYHMKTGMARVVRYMSYKPSPELAQHEKHDPHLHDHTYFDGMVETATNHAQAQFRLSKTWDTLEAHVESREYDSLDEFEGELLYRRWFTNFFNIVAGGNYFAEYEDDNTRGVLGIGYTLPLLIESNLLVDHKGKFRLDLEKRFQWTKYVFTDAEVSFREQAKTEFEISLMYANRWDWSAGFMFTEEDVGIGAQYRF